MTQCMNFFFIRCSKLVWLFIVLSAYLGNSIAIAASPSHRCMEFLQPLVCAAAVSCGGIPPGSTPYTQAVYLEATLPSAADPASSYSYDNGFQLQLTARSGSGKLLFDLDSPSNTVVSPCAGD